MIYLQGFNEQKKYFSLSQQLNITNKDSVNVFVVRKYHVQAN